MAKHGAHEHQFGAQPTLPLIAIAMLDPRCHHEQIAGNATDARNMTDSYPRLVFDELSPAVAGRTNSFRLKVGDGFRGTRRWVAEARPPRVNGARF